MTKDMSNLFVKRRINNDEAFSSRITQKRIFTHIRT